MIFLIFINFSTISSLVYGISFSELDDSDDERTARLNIYNNAGQIIDVKTKEENGTLVYNNMLDSGWKIFGNLKPSTYIIEISSHEGQQDPTELRILIYACTSLNVISDPNGVIEVQPQRCIGSVVDSLNKFGSVANIPESIDQFR